MKTDMIILALVFFCGLFVYSDGCSCLPQHPQQQYCNSHFVILARVKRERIFNETKIYKVRVRKEYKVSEKGVVALKSGRLITPRHDSLCGIQLQPGKLYVLSGRIYNLRGHINLCNMAIEWQNLTRKQRKGLKLLYQHGCSCQIKSCSRGKCYREKDACTWTSKCHVKEGICQRQINKSCMWTRNRALTKCLQEDKRKL